MPVVSGRFIDHIDLGVLTRTVPPELVDEVVRDSGCQERRRRLLPARVVVYVVLGLCLFHSADGFCPPGYRAVMQLLVRRFADVFAGVVVVSGSAVAQARGRLTDKPLQALFERVSGPLAEQQTQWSHAFGLRLVAWDATTVAVADSAGNAAAFGYHGQRREPGPAAAPTGGGGDASRGRGGAALGACPLVRVMTLTECGTHAVVHAVFDGVHTSEQVLARQLLAGLQEGMLLLGDRNFPGYELWGLAAATGADLLWRLKTNVIMVPERVLPDGSVLARMPTPAETRRLANRRRHGRPALPTSGHLVRVIAYTITVTINGVARTEQFRLITTLLDPDQAPAAALAALYHQRWEAETSYSQLKPRLIGRDNVLRSHTPTGVAQEIYGLLIVYQALCALRLATATTADLDPDRISFLVTLRTVRTHLTDRNPHPDAHHHVTADILAHTLPPRRRRSTPRQRRAHPGKYLTKRRDQPRPTGNATYHIQLPPPPAQTP